MDNLQILYYDNHLVVVIKPMGMTIDTLTQEAAAWTKKRFDKKGEVFLHPAHQLDKAVSGIVVMAKTSKALARLNEIFRNKTDITKEYIALVEGFLPASDILEDGLMHGEYKAHILPLEDPRAKKARLTYVTLGHWKEGSIVKIFLETGRYHQIRAQFAHIGSPVVGDHKYGSRHLFAAEGIALTHHRLSLIHPVQKIEMEWICPFNNSFEKFLTQNGGERVQW